MRHGQRSPSPSPCGKRSDRLRRGVTSLFRRLRPSRHPRDGWGTDFLFLVNVMAIQLPPGGLRGAGYHEHEGEGAIVHHLPPRLPFVTHRRGMKRPIHTA